MTTGNHNAQEATREIIDRFGGVARLADLLNLRPWAIYSWRDRGIPPRRYQQLLMLAQREGVDLTIEELFAAEGRTSAA